MARSKSQTESIHQLSFQLESSDVKPFVLFSLWKLMKQWMRCRNLLIKIPFLFAHCTYYTWQHTPQTISVKWLQILCFHFNSSNVFARPTKAFDGKIEKAKKKKLVPDWLRVNQKSFIPNKCHLCFAVVNGMESAHCPTFALHTIFSHISSCVHC